MLHKTPLLLALYKREKKKKRETQGDSTLFYLISRRLKSQLGNF